MPIGQNLLALMGAELPRDKFAAFTSMHGAKGESAEAEGFAGFSAILAAQQPAELKALFNQLSQVQVQASDAAEALPEIAADGKSLPAEIRDWLQKLSMLESPQQQSVTTAETDAGELTEASEQSSEEAMSLLSGLSGQWQQWLAQLPQQDSGVAEGDALASSSPAAATNGAAQLMADTTSASAGLPADKVIPATAGTLSLPDILAQLRAAMTGSVSAQEAVSQTATGSESDASAKKVQVGEGDDKLLNQARQLAQGDQPQQTQRVANLAASADPQGLFAARLAEQKTGEPGKLESAAIDALDSKAATTAGATQSALTQRPVAAAAQPPTVPFGQTGWSESVVNKVMWMSSQNLKSVEIQLDPAELGPLEIKIQTRGQEHQVQFVSQNPSVREALEGQMHRLRELFSQQGVDQLNVSVSDGNAGRQSGSEARGSFAGGESNGREGGSAGSGAQLGSEDELPMAAAQSIAANSRLVDYYA